MTKDARTRPARRSCVATRDFREKPGPVRIVALALAGFVAAVGLIDDVESSTPPDHAVVAMALAERSERILDLHGKASIAAGKGRFGGPTMCRSLKPVRP
jgi:hypothetical protein